MTDDDDDDEDMIMLMKEIFTLKVLRKKSLAVRQDIFCSNVFVI